MKLIVYEMKDLAESREIFEKKPKIIFSFIVYLIISLFMVAIIFCCVFDMEIVVKARGIVRPTDKVSSLRNKIIGRVDKVYINYIEGTRVKKGDIIYSLDIRDYQASKQFSLEQINKSNKEISGLETILYCIQNEILEENAKSNFSKNDEYYSGYLKFYNTVSKLNNQIKQNKKDYDIKQNLAQAGQIPKNDALDAKILLDNSEYELKIYKNQYIYDLQKQIIDNKQNLYSSEKDLKTADFNIDNAVIRAPIDGIIKIINEISVGDVLSVNYEICNIVPDANQFTMYIYVNNKDINEIKKGQKIRYHFDALAYQEYGEMFGKIIEVGADSIVDLQSKSNQYFALGSIEPKILHSYKGIEGEVKIGMTYEAQIVTRKKKIILFMLEEVKLIFTSY
jgi:membrane fusion protein, peptide pheromone/bacteriocin exporter